MVSIDYGTLLVGNNGLRKTIRYVPRPVLLLLAKLTFIYCAYTMLYVKLSKHAVVEYS